MATRQSPMPRGEFSGQAPKYIQDVSKAMAAEVRQLMQEVGSLRDERQKLQREIADLMATKAKHSAYGGGGGEYNPPWMDDFDRLAIEAPPGMSPGMMPGMMPGGMPGGMPPGMSNALVPVPQPDDGPPVAAKPGWRRVSKKPDPAASMAHVQQRRAARTGAVASPPPPPPPAPAPEPPGFSWKSWKPNPAVTPVARGHGQMMSPPPRAGLFGPSTPPPQ